MVPPPPGEDSPRSYAIRICENMIREDIRLGFLFSVGLEFQSDLELGVLSEGFRQAFEDHGISLSENVTIEEEVEGSRWQIDDTDQGHTYIVIVGDETLNIYRLGKDLVGIRTYNGDMMIVNNYIESLHSGIKVTDHGIGGHLISGNILREVKLGIKLWGAWVRTVVAGNVIYLRPPETDTAQRDGIALALIDSSGIEDCVVEGNSIYCGESEVSGLRGISIWCDGSSGYPVNGLVIANNQLSGLYCGIWSRSSALPAIGPHRMWIHGNYFRECDYDIEPVLTGYGDGVIIQDNLVAA